MEPLEDMENVNILLVDDRHDGLLSLEAVLKSPEYNLVKANSGREALSLLLNYDFAVILLDVQMPDLDGFQTARIIKRNELFKHIPIIFVTAINKEQKKVDEGYVSGAVDYIFKPFEPHILRSKVGVFVDLFRKNRKIKEQTRLLLQSERRERERRLSELELENLRRYRNLADAIPHIVWKVDADGTFDYFNRFWFEYTGLSLEQSYQEGWQAVLHPGDYLTLLQKWDEIRKSGSELETECRILKNSDGKYRWHLVRIVPETTNGILSGWLGTCTDIHDRKEIQEGLELRIQERTLELSLVNQALKEEMEERLKAQREILRVSEREQRRIGQDLHDGLAQELVAISFMSQILYEKLEEKGAEEAEDTLRILNHLRKSVEETRSLSRGFYPIELERHGLLAALQEMAVNTEKMFSISFRYQFEESADVEDRAKAYHLYRITQEAVHNIIKHSKARNISLSVCSEEDCLVLSIEDDGVGFEKTENTSSGMGLQTMQHRARTIGGILNVTSSPGKGTIVTCKASLPNGRSNASQVRKESLGGREYPVTVD